jgi:hypothetical protein
VRERHVAIQHLHFGRLVRHPDGQHFHDWELERDERHDRVAGE